MKELYIVFVTSHADTIGNNVRLSLIEGLSRQYKTTCFTNQYQFIKDRNLCDRTISLPEYNGIFKRIPILSSLIDARKKALTINKFLNKSPLFIFHDTSEIALFVNRQTTIYNCVHQIHEFEGFYKRTGPGIISQKLKKYFLLKGVKRSQYCFVISSTIQKYLTAQGITNKMLITPHFVELEKYKHPAVESSLSKEILLHNERGRFVAVYTGWVSENRGLQLMLQTAKDLSAHDKKFITYIIGCSDEYYEKINTYATDNMIIDNLVPVKKLDAIYIPYILKSCDVCFSFLERNQVFEVSPPQKVIEYFAAGKPVIANNIKTHEELISNGKNGFLCDTPEETVKIILMLSEDEALRNKIQSEAVSTAEKYSKENIIRSICEIINVSPEYND